ncbi:hypothetical protein Taro_023847 [Colocasia esculenta]|uniref:Uncharacterized protein n=1 Tax=Colocasia esculenta TaxID=4460 RepID=A0A843V4T5_COLES|nr:hypothetical protein [Colocasia esculenta]
MAFPEYLFCCLGQQVDTRSYQVDTRWLSQKTCFAVWDMCRHTSWVGRHTPESLCLKHCPGHVAP